MKKSFLFRALFAHMLMLSIVDGDAAAAAAAPVDPAPADPAGSADTAPAATATGATAADGVEAQEQPTGEAEQEDPAAVEDANEGGTESWVKQELHKIVTEVEAGFHNGVEAIHSLIAKL
jgi:hypothetical protein